MPESTSRFKILKQKNGGRKKTKNQQPKLQSLGNKGTQNWSKYTRLTCVPEGPSREGKRTIISSHMSSLSRANPRAKTLQKKWTPGSYCLLKDSAEAHIYPL